MVLVFISGEGCLVVLADLRCWNNLPINAIDPSEQNPCTYFRDDGTAERQCRNKR